MENQMRGNPCHTTRLRNGTDTGKPELCVTVRYHFFIGSKDSFMSQPMEPGENNHLQNLIIK